MKNITTCTLEVTDFFDAVSTFGNRSLELIGSHAKGVLANVREHPEAITLVFTTTKITVRYHKLRSMVSPSVFTVDRITTLKMKLTNVAIKEIVDSMCHIYDTYEIPAHDVSQEERRSTLIRTHHALYDEISDMVDSMGSNGEDVSDWIRSSPMMDLASSSTILQGPLTWVEGRDLVMVDMNTIPTVRLKDIVSSLRSIRDHVAFLKGEFGTHTTEDIINYIKYSTAPDYS